MPPACAPPTAALLPWLALGDSYTIGENVSEAARWPAQLTAVLRDRGVNIADPILIARTGWTTTRLAEALAAEDPAGPFPLVTLMIGVNDQFSGVPLPDFRTEFAALLMDAIALAGGDPQRVVVISIPDWGATPFAHRQDRAQISAEIEAFNEAMVAETAAAGAHSVNVTDLSRRALNDAALTSDDFLHPSAEMYALWVQEMLPAVCAAISRAGD